MSRPQGHRKSQSTSALNVLAGSSSRHDLASLSRPSRRRQPTSGLPSVEESASMAQLPGLTDRSRRQSRVEIEAAGDIAQPARRHSRRAVATMDDVRGWLNDIRSLRSSERRRLAALKGLEEMLVHCCSGDGRVLLKELIAAHIHEPLLALTARHAQALALQASATQSTLSADDGVAAVLVPELAHIVTLLQGLCLLSRHAKSSVGESWVLEVLIDLLLLLRAQLPADGERPIVYSILELLCCTLVDSPSYAREFERLSGLEAVVRVLKGTGVAKEVRMKCIEFLYFYLLPEQNGTQRAASSSSSSSSSSAESALFPPSPLSASTSSDTSSRVITPSPAVRDPPHMLQSHYPDIDMSFVPMTPHKRPQPNLGYLTPSTTRRPSSSLSTTPSLPPVPASPRVPASPSTRRLASLVETSPEHTKVTETPRQSVPSREWRRSSMIEEKDAGLGFGLPSNQSGLKRSATAIRLSDDKPTFSDPFVTSSAARSGSGSSSGSSTVIQHRRSMSRSSIHISTKEATPGSQIHRSSQSAAQRSTKSHMSQSTMLPPPPPIRASDKEAEPRPPKIRHSRTQSHLSALATASNADRPPVPPLPTSLAPPSTPSGLTRSPSSRPGRAFPAELTRGLPPSASSPALTPLGVAKRVASGGRPSLSVDKAKVPHEKVKPKGVKSVEEKKEMLGMWLGNVDQLVQGVEKVSFWGSISGAARRRP